MDPINTGKFIQELRKAKKLTQNDLADLLQVTNKAVSRWETGEGFPDVVLLPRLSEVLSVTIDDILKGERIEKIALHHSLEKQKLLNVYKICLAIMSLSFVLFIGLTYTTFKAWIGFMAYVIPGTLALVWILIARSNYMVVCEYDDNDKKVLFDTLRTSVILYAVLFAVMFIQFLALGIVFAYNFMSFQDIILLSFVAGGLVFFGTSWYFNLINIKQDKLQTVMYKKITAYFAIILIIFLGMFLLSPLNKLFPYEGIPIISVISVSFLVYISFGVYYLMKKTDSIKIFLLRIITIIALVFVSLFSFFFEGDSIVLLALPIIIYFSILLLSIAGFILKFVHYKKDSLFRLYFQNIFLLVYFFFYIFGLIFLIVIVIIFGTLDLFVNKKIDSKNSIDLNENQN